jgi:hypothetical protein
VKKLSKRDWITPLVISVVSGSVLFLYTQQLQNTRLTQTTYAVSYAPVWQLTPSEISKIQYETPTQKISAFLNGDNTWQLMSPMHTSADNQYINNLISNFHQLPAIESIPVTSSDLERFGIDESSPTLTLYDKEHNKYKLIKGDTIDVVYDYVYSPNTGSVYKVSQTAFSNLSEDISEWYRHDYLNFKNDTVKTVTFTQNGKSHQIFSHTLEDGTITFQSDTLSAAGLDSLLHFLKTSQLKDLILKNAGDSVIAMYNLDEPDITLSLAFNDGTIQTFLISLEITSDYQIYVLSTEDNAIFSIPSYNFEAIK